MKHSPWFSSASPIPSPTPPNQCDVVIVGSGFVALHLACRLAHAGVSCCLLEERRLPCSGIARGSTGQVQFGLGDNVFRLVQALGETQTKEIMDYCAQGISLLHQSNAFVQHGGVHIASLPNEGKELTESAVFLEKMGYPCTPWTATKIHLETNTQALKAGYLYPLEGLVDLQKLYEYYSQQATKLRISIHCGIHLHEIGEHTDSLCIRHNQGTLLTQTVIFTSLPSNLQQLEPFFRHKIYPVRAQAIAIPHQKAQPCRYSVELQQGHIYWRDTPHHRIIAGCRWASPHLEVGESNDQQLHPKIDHQLQQFAQRHFPSHQPPTPSHKWAAIMDFSCDGLPIVGALPGRHDILACCGFHGRNLTLGLRSAEAVANLLLDGIDPALPSLLYPGRFL